MNLSLKKRVAISFGIATLVVLILAFTVFNYLDALNRKITEISTESDEVSSLIEAMRVSTVTILKYQRKILSNAPTEDIIAKLISNCEDLISQTQRLDSMYIDPDINNVIRQMRSYSESLKIVLGKTSVFDRDTSGISNIGDFSDKILDAFAEFQNIQMAQSVERNRKIKSIITETKRSMMITLIIGFLGTIILALVVPGKIALPFKKIKDAIRELQDCNFDVSIYYNQDDEIGEIARDMNKMIRSFKTFEELRSDRIQVENRKFDALANMVKKPVLVVNAFGHLIYMNNKLYSLLQVQSDDVIGKEMTDSIIPKSIIESFQMAIKRRSKIENAEVRIFAKKPEVEDIDAGSVSATQAYYENRDEKAPLRLKIKDKKEEEELIFSGFANVIPIRGKDSSLDYYLMVLSQEVFV